MEDGLLKSAVMVGDGTIVGDVVDTPVTPLEQPPHREEVPTDTVHAEILAAETSVEQGPQGAKVPVKSERVDPLVEVDESVQVERKRSREPEDVVASVLGEVDCKQAGGSTEAGVGQDLLVQTIMSQTPTSQLAQATEADPTLTTARALANTLSEGYYWQEHLLFRTRLDKIGDTKEQLCLPAEYRPKCMKMAHEHFGHLGRNKMTEQIRKFFHWPTITGDCMRHIKSCPQCQTMD